jgi:hypothetical protein
MDSGKTVSSTDLRANLKEYLKAAAKNRVVSSKTAVNRPNTLSTKNS